MQTADIAKSTQCWCERPILPAPLRSRSNDFFQHPLTAPLPLMPFSTRSAPFSAPLTLRSHALVTSLTIQGHMTSSVTWPFDSPYIISFWWSFGTKPISNGFRDIQRRMSRNGWHDLDATSKRRYIHTYYIHIRLLHRMTERICTRSKYK